MLVEVWSDVACPWCAVGRAHLGAAIDALPWGDEVAVRWRSFELDPTAPAVRDGSYVDRLAGKYRTSPDEARGMIERMTAQGAAVGLAFDFDRIRPGNTFDAHRLLHLAADRGCQDALKARLQAAYLGEGAAIGTADALRALAADVDLDAAEVDAVLAGDAYADEVRADERQAVAYGVSGVPFFVVDGRYGVPGAQPPDVLVGVLERARADAAGGADPAGGHAADHDHGAHDDHDHAACADGSCAVG